MKRLTEYICEAISDRWNDSYGKSLNKASGTLYTDAKKFANNIPSFNKNTFEKENFIDEFSKTWHPGEGETIGNYYLALYCAKNYNVKLLNALNHGDYNRGEQHFTIAYVPLDSKSRTAKWENPCEENTSFSTKGGYHGNESDINWHNEKIKSIKDYAKIIYDYLENIFKNK